MSRTSPGHRALPYVLGCLAVTLGGCQPTAASELACPSATSDPWHECARDDVSIPCKPEHSATTLVIRWRDGVVHRFTCPGKCVPNGQRIDEHEERWQHELFIQGNSRYTNVRTGASLFVPLRPPRGTE